MWGLKSERITGFGISDVDILPLSVVKAIDRTKYELTFMENVPNLVEI